MLATAGGCLGEFQSDPPFSLILALAPSNPPLSVQAEYLVGSGLQIRNAATGETVTLSGDESVTFPLSAEGQAYDLSVINQPANPTQSCSFVGSPMSSGVIRGNTTVRLECSLAVRSTDPPLPGVMSTTQNIRVIFNRSMDTGQPCALGGATTIGPAPPIGNYSWATTRYPNDTIVINGAPWNTCTGPGGCIAEMDSTTCRAADGSAAVSAMQVNEVYILDVARLRYVAPGGVDNVAAGNSPTTPMASIPFAITDIVTDTGGCGAGPLLCAILVGADSGGTVYGGAVSMVNGLALLGGYSRDFSTRNFGVYVTRLDSGAGCALGADMANDPCATVRFGDGLNASASLQGFYVIGPSTVGYSAGVSFRDGGQAVYNTIAGGPANTISAAGVFTGANVGGGAVVRQNVIVGDESGSSPVSVGVLVLNPIGGDVQIQENTISGGASPTSDGIRVANNSQAIISRNVIFGGDGLNYSRGIFLNGTPRVAGVRIYNNVIGAGREDGATVSADGISLFETTNRAQILNNTVFATTATESFAIRSEAPAATNSRPDVRNNILGATTGCYLELHAIANPTLYQNNALVCPALFDRRVPPNLVTTLPALVGLGYLNNITDVPVFQNPSDPFSGFQLSTSSSCNIINGGDPATMATVPNDRNGAARTAGVPGPGAGQSIGAYEQDAGCTP